MCRQMTDAEHYPYGTVLAVVGNQQGLRRVAELENPNHRRFAVCLMEELVLVPHQ